MKHIVIDARFIDSSTGRYAQKLIRNLAIIDQSNTYTIIVGVGDSRLLRLPENFKVVEIDAPIGTVKEQLKLLRLINKLKPDLVHFGMVQQPVLYRGRVVTTMHDLTTVRFRNPAKNPITFTLKQTVYKWVNKHAARKSDHIITPTEYVKHDVAQYAHIEPTKITTIYEAADKIIDPPEPVGEVAGSRYIMYVGRPLPHKNLGRLIAAFAMLKKSHPDLKLVIAGRKDLLMSKLEQNTNMKGIEGVVFTGYVSEGQLRWLYEHTAAYIFPSLSEGFGLPGLEAMIHGAPVIASKATCLPEVYDGAAKFFDPLEVEGMAEAINDVLTDEQLRKSLITKGKKHVAKFSWKRTTEQTLDIYKKILGI